MVEERTTAIFQGIALTGNNGSHVSDGRCKHDTAPRISHTQTFSRVWLKGLNRAQHPLFVASSQKSHLRPHRSCFVRSRR